MAGRRPCRLVRMADRIGAVLRRYSRRVDLEAAGDARTTAHLPPAMAGQLAARLDARIRTPAASTPACSPITLRHQLRFAQPVLARLADAGVNALADVTPLLLHRHLTACHLIGMSAHDAAGRPGDHRVPNLRRGRGDWTAICLDSVPIALALGLVHLVAAEAPNRAPASNRRRKSTAPYGPPGIGRRNAAAEFLAHFLAVAGLFGAVWTLRWVHWPVAATEYDALAAVHCAAPDFRRPAKLSRSSSAAPSRMLVAGPAWTACQTCPGARSPAPCNDCPPPRCR